MKVRFFTIALLALLYTGQVLANPGPIKISPSGLEFPDGSPQTTAADGGSIQQSDNGTSIYYASANAGIETTSPKTMLEIDGGVKISNDTSTCDSEKAGTIRWSGSAFQGCDGGSWRTLSYLPTSVTNVSTVVSTTGRVWMDRNLGASRVATNKDDLNAYGDLYQWGRLADGHESRSSPTVTSRSPFDAPNHGNFILAIGNGDWLSSSNNNLWQGVPGTNNPCPAGFRLPTLLEWQTEKSDWSEDSADGAFLSSLKLPAGGWRDPTTGGISIFIGLVGNYWSSDVTVSEPYSYYMVFSTTQVTSFPYSERAEGKSVRCIKDQTL